MLTFFIQDSAGHIHAARPNQRTIYTVIVTCHHIQYSSGVSAKNLEWKTNSGPTIDISLSSVMMINWNVLMFNVLIDRVMYNVRNDRGLDNPVLNRVNVRQENKLFRKKIEVKWTVKVVWLKISGNIDNIFRFTSSYLRALVDSSLCIQKKNLVGSSSWVRKKISWVVVCVSEMSWVGKKTSWVVAQG